MDDRPLRVLLVAPSPRMTGGQAVQAVLLRRGLEQMGVQVRLLPIDLPLPSALQRLPLVRTALRLVVFLALLLWHAPHCRVVHVFTAARSPFYLWSVPAMLVGRFCRRQVILHYHSGLGPTHLAQAAWLVRPLMRLAHHLVVPSDYLREAFAEQGLSAIVIQNVLDLEAFQYRKRQGMRPVVLVARLLEPVYNIPCALRAFQVLEAAWPRAELLIAGDGSQRPALEQMVADEGIKGVTFLGAVPWREMPACYHRADILLNTPDADNSPNCLLEAFACGLPVVTTDAGGIRYLVTHMETGLLAPVGDSAALGAHLVWVMAHQEEAIELARRARERCQEFTWGQAGPRWLALYRGEP